MARFSPKWFFRELRRRRVFNTVAIYIVGAWVALQVADLAFPGLDIPDFAIRHVWVGTFLLFPLVLVFAWRYDIGGGSIKRTLPAEAPKEADRSLHRADRLMIGGLSSVAVAVIAIMVVQVGRIEPEYIGPPRDNSIAVMPFDVCEGRLSDAVMASGLTSEVINRLAERDRLKVIARNSSHAMAGLGSSVSRIATLLRVRYVLAGVVCRDGFDMTLDVELADNEGFIVWRESYAQVVNRFDQIEQRLAALVANGVAVELGDVIPAPADVPVNRLAYEQLVIGREYAVREDYKEARAAFDKVLQYEPENTEAIFALAILVEKEALSEGTFGLTSVEEAWPIGGKALELARRQLAEGRADFRAHAVMGGILYEMGKWDRHLTWRQAGDLDQTEMAARLESSTARFAEAESHLRTALALNPSEISAYELLAYILEQQGTGRRAEALEIFEQGLSRDPFNTKLNRDVSARWAARGRYRQAMELLERFEALPEVPPYAWHAQLELAMTQGYLDEKCELLIEMLLRDPEAFKYINNYGHLMLFPGNLAELGLYEEAEAWYLQVEKIPAKAGWASTMREWGVNSYLYAVGLKKDDPQEKLALIAGKSDEEILEEGSEAAYWLAEAGEYERAIRLMEAEQHSRFDSPLRAERRAGPRLQLAGLYQVVGRDADAASLLEDVVRDLEVEFDDGIRHPTTLEHLADAYALQGNDEAALEMLHKSVDYHGWYCPGDPEADHLDLDADPWARLRDDPRLIALCQRIESDRHLQASRLRAILSQYDVDEVLAPVIAWAEKDAEREAREE